MKICRGLSAAVLAATLAVALAPAVPTHASASASTDVQVTAAAPDRNFRAGFTTSIAG